MSKFPINGSDTFAKRLNKYFFFKCSLNVSKPSNCDGSA